MSVSAKLGFFIKFEGFLVREGSGSWIRLIMLWMKYLGTVLVKNETMRRISG